MGSLVGRRFRSARAVVPHATGAPSRRVGPVAFDQLCLTTLCLTTFDPFFLGAAGDDGHQGRRGRGPRRQRPHRVAPLALVSYIPYLTANLYPLFDLSGQIHCRRQRPHRVTPPGSPRPITNIQTKKV